MQNPWKIDKVKTFKIMALAFVVIMILMIISFGVSTVIGTIMVAFNAMEWSGLVAWLESPVQEIKVWHALFIVLILKMI